MTWSVATSSADLLALWQSRSAELAWTFPGDWADPAAEAVCEAVCSSADIWPPAERLGRSRAAVGVSLAETLADIDVLASMIDGSYAEPLRRAVSLGWADRVTAPPIIVSDPLTGLVTADYLKVRLSETYRAAEVAGTPAGEGWALVLVKLDLTGRNGWSRVLPMILAADCMRAVFDGGRTLAQLGPCVAAVLTERDSTVARRARLLAAMVESQTNADPQATIPAPQVWIENLPAAYGTALALLGELGR
jgi:hypothetical protein